MPDKSVKTDSPSAAESGPQFAPQIPDHEMVRRIGGGSYGEVWLARSIMGTYRAVKIVYRKSFDNDRPYERVRLFPAVSFRRFLSSIDASRCLLEWF